MSNLNDKYPLADAMKQVSAVSIKSDAVEIGKTAVFAGFKKGKVIDGAPNDTVFYVIDGVRRSISVREYLKMKVVGGASLINAEESDSITFVPKFTVTESEPRLYNGEKSYPLNHYKLAKEMFSDVAGTREFDYAELVEGGFKPESKALIADGKVDAIQNYTIEL